MSVVVITPPAPLVDLGLAKLHLGVDAGDRDALITAYIAAASAHIDGPGGWLGRSIGVQTLEARLDRFDCDLVRLHSGPLISVLSVKYDDSDGVEQTLAGDAYSLDPRGVLAAYGTTWPAARLRAGSVRVRYVAGHVADATADPLVPSIPAPITAAVLLMVGDLFANRETAVTGTIAASIPMSTTVENLLAPYRVWSV